jgi:hypothetical protein
MADAVATFAINLEDETSGGASSADSALKKLKTSIEDDTKALRALERMMKQLQAGSSINVGTHKALATQIDQTKNRIAASTDSWLKLGGHMTDTTRRTRDATERIGHVGKELKAAEEKVVPFGKRLRELGESTSRLGGPLGMGGLGPIVTGLGTALESPALAAVVLGAAIIAVTAAVVIGAAMLAAYIVKMADAARTNRIFTDAVAGSEAGGKELRGVIDRISQSVPLAKEKIQGLAVSLSQAGLQGKDLESGLHAVSTAAAVLGDAAGEKLKSLLESKSADKGRFKAVADDFQNAGVQLDDVAHALADNLGVSFDRAKAAIQAGNVSLADGTAALDKAVSKNLGGSADKLNNSLGAIGDRAKPVQGVPAARRLHRRGLHQGRRRKGADGQARGGEHGGSTHRVFGTKARARIDERVQRPEHLPDQRRRSGGAQGDDHRHLRELRPHVRRAGARVSDPCKVSRATHRNPAYTLNHDERSEADHEHPPRR